MNRLAILGASGHGKVIADLAECCGWREVFFFDDAWPHVETNGCWAVSGTSHQILDQLDKFDGVVVAIGNNRVRAEKLSWLAKSGAEITTLVHPSATVSRYATLGLGTIVMAGAVVNADTEIGEGVILNTGCSIDHDCTIGDYVHISPGARLAGGVRVDTQSWVGMGAAVRQLISIGNKVVVGAGAVVVSDFPDGVTVVGVPAKVITGS